MGKRSKDNPAKPSETRKYHRASGPAGLDEPDAKELFSVIGFALSLWSGIEDAVSLIYGGLVEGGMPLLRGHAAINSAEARLEVLVASAAWIFRDDDAKYQNVLAFERKIIKAAGFRNRFAHGRVFKVDYRELDCEKTASTFVLTSSPLSSRHNKAWLHPKMEFDVDEARVIVKHFQAIAAAIDFELHRSHLEGTASLFNNDFLPDLPALNLEKYA